MGLQSLRSWSVLRSYSIRKLSNSWWSVLSIHKNKIKSRWTLYRNHPWRRITLKIYILKDKHFFRGIKQSERLILCTKYGSNLSDEFCPFDNTIKLRKIYLSISWLKGSMGRISKQIIRTVVEYQCKIKFIKLLFYDFKLNQF